MENNRIIELNNVTLRYCNFAGRQTRYNDAGNRNFNVVLSEEDYQRMLDAGMNVRVRPPRNEGDDPTYLMKVNVSYEYRRPRVIFGDGENFMELDEDSLYMIDDADADGSIVHVDLTFRPSRSSKRTDDYGLSAYLKSIEVVVEDDPIVKRQNERLRKSEEAPF